MRLGKSSSRNSLSFYVIQDIKNLDGTRTTEVLEKLGTAEEIRKEHPDTDPEAWAKEHIRELRKKEGKDTLTVIQKFKNNIVIPKNEQKLYQGGYLFVDAILHRLGLEEALKSVSAGYSFHYDLYEIFKNLVSSRFLSPCSKRAGYDFCTKYMMRPSYELHDVYRALPVIGKHTMLLQEAAYRSSTAMVPRNTHILYYDCTNFYFEINAAEDKKQYGHSKEHRPNPIIGMGLFLDGSGFPLAYQTFAGNRNEQGSLQTLETKILKEFKVSDIVVCTDAGLSSAANRKFNDLPHRYFITTQSLKKLRKYQKEWVFADEGWLRFGGADKKTYTMAQIRTMPSDELFYRERWIIEDGLEQRLVVSYSQKYADYQRVIREGQLARAEKKIERGDYGVNRNPNSPDRFIEVKRYTKDGKVCDRQSAHLDEERAEGEAEYDGLYAVCTNLEWNVEDIVRVNKQRWQIERAFRILKTDFSARPVYVSLEESIEGHFTVCFFALLVLKLIEKKIGGDTSSEKLIETLRNMCLFRLGKKGYTPAFKRTDLTDRIHDAFGFRLDYELLDVKKLKKILKICTGKNITHF